MSLVRKAILVTVLCSSSLISRGEMNISNRSQDAAPENPAFIEMDLPTSELLGKPGERPYRVGGKVYVKVKDSD